jgi:Flp pilus assembly protein TadG
MKSSNWENARTACSIFNFFKHERGSSLLQQRSKWRFFVARVPSKKLRGSEGNALVELALTLPIVFMVLTGVFSLAIALSQKLELAEAVSSGGRVLAVDRGDNDPCSAATSAIRNAAPGLTSSKLTLSYNLDGNAYGSGVTTCPGSGGTPNSYMVEGGTATVSATYPCTITVFGTGILSCTLSTQVTEAVQ